MKKVIYLPLFAIAMLFFVACKTEPKSKHADSIEKAPTTVQSRLRAEPDKLVPILTTKSTSLQVADILFPTLLNFDVENYTLSPVLAKARPERKEITEGKHKGGIAYTYEIHPEAVWDNGSPVLASDYVFTMKALFNPHVKATAYQNLLSFIKDIEIDADNPKRFTVYVTTAFRSESSSGFYVLPEYVYDPEKIMRSYALSDLTDPKQKKKLSDDTALKKFASFFNAQGSPGTAISSCGAYKLVEWETGQRIILQKKKNWWGNKLAEEYPLLLSYPEEVIFKPMPDDMACIAAMKGGQVDVAGKLNASMFLEFKNSPASGGFRFFTPELLMYTYLGLNMKRPHLSDKRVRRALAHLTDVQQMIETVQHNMAKPTVGPFPPNAPYIDKSLQPIPYDVDRAKTLLAAAGWADSDGDGILDKVIKGKKTPLVVKVASTASEVSQNNIAIMKEDAIKAGVVIEPVVVSPSQLFREVLPHRDFDAFVLAAGFDLDLYDPSQFWHTASDTPSGSNRFGFGNAQTDAVIDELRATDDEGRRRELYIQLQKIIYEEQPCIFLYQPKDRIVISKAFKNAKTTLRNPGYYEPLFH